ncbi:MAG: nucleotidyltransferase [Candidatus Nitrosocaldaceae archaeon]|nr:MAG: nucleotidyltransferase [Candidatus Nitrosocaldaceae archaeon]
MKKDIIKILERELPYLKEKYGVKSLGIFGSYVKGKQKESSDIDILIEFDKPISIFKFLEIEEHLSNLLGIKVDLVSRKGLKDEIKDNILREVIYV